jgi:O-succinylbenzoate synthase
MLIKGPSGWGEFAPFDDYDIPRSARWLAAALEASWGEFPAAHRSSVDVNAIIPAVESPAAGALARAAIVDNGCRTIKVKIGTSVAGDEARVVAVRDALDSTGADGRIRLDVNGMWSLDQARTSLRRLGRYGIEYVEQPCRDLDDVARLRAEIDIPIAIDEGIRLADDPTTVRLQGIADYAICKPMTLGGAAATGRVAEAVGVPVVISGSLDSSIGLASCVAIAASLPDLPLASGLGTGTLFERDLVEPSLVPTAGGIGVKRVAPDVDLLMQANQEVSDSRRQWWQRRLGDAYRFLRDQAPADAPLNEQMEG